MSAAEIAGAVMFFLTVSGALWTIWWRIDGRLTAAKQEVSDRASQALTLAATAREEVAAHRLHVAETYITKEGLRDVKDEIMEALHGVKGSIDHLGGRIDSMYAQGVTAPRARKAA